jgi:L-histidine N-alpha-methyltransferase
MPTPRVDTHLTASDLRAALEADVTTGLAATPKELPPKWFYDQRGSELFDEITRLPEYYPTRREREILEREAGAIAAFAPDTLVELGSGSGEKAGVLLPALRRAGLTGYVPVDVSDQFLRTTAQRWADDHPWLRVHAVVADFEHQLDRLPGDGRRLVAFLGGTIGNLEPVARKRFFTELRASLAAGEGLLLGTDLVKDRDRLVRAYDDAAGVTAEFNRNVLRVINRELGADFEVDGFRHVARWDPHAEHIEMWLRSDAGQEVRIDALDLEVRFDPGEAVRTEISAKFRPEGVAGELGAAGFELDRWWTDARGDFGLSLSIAV